MTNKCDLEEILKDLPAKWRDAIIKILLKIQDDIQSVDCDTVRSCETLTTLSEFTQEGSEICITYTDEHGVSVERCFDLETTINNELDGIDPGCVVSQEDWDQMTYTQRFQALIDGFCNCCSTTTSTSTTTTTTTP